jgi:hypothetical protein
MSMEMRRHEVDGAVRAAPVIPSLCAAKERLGPRFRRYVRCGAVAVTNSAAKKPASPPSTCRDGHQIYCVAHSCHLGLAVAEARGAEKGGQLLKEKLSILVRVDLDCARVQIVAKGMALHEACRPCTWSQNALMRRARPGPGNRHDTRTGRAGRSRTAARLLALPSPARAH